MKKILFCILCLAVVLIGAHATVSAAEAPVTVAVGTATGETACIVPTDGVVYLPSCVAPHAVPLVSEGELAFLADGAWQTLATGETLDLTPFLTTDARGARCYRVALRVSGEVETVTFYSDGALPALFVTTSRGLSYIEAGKENRDKEARVLLLTPDGETEYSDLDGETVSEIKGRGNATWGYYKKPYQLKLGKKTALLGMEKAKTWILLAGYTDQSALHNALAFTLAEALGVPFAIDYRFVSLYIDGEYRGLYMISEKVQIDSARVNIRDLEKENERANPDTELSELSLRTVTGGELIARTILTSYTYCEGMASPEDITGGYLVELDNIRGMSEPCRFVTENGNIYVVKSPEYASREEVEYIAELFADMEEAIFSETGYNTKGIHYSEYMDAESFAAIYTAQELLKNWDAYLSSMFFFKDADTDGVRARIFMGPLWDMDNTLGNINFNRDYGTDTAYLWAQNGVFQSYPRDFAKKLMSHADFSELVETVYHTAYREVMAYLAEGGWLDARAGELTDAVTMDRTRWTMCDPNGWLLNAAGRKTSVKFVQFAEYGTARDEDQTTALGFLRYYLSTRAEALLDSLGGGTLPPVTQTTESTSLVTTVSATPQTTEETSTPSEPLQTTALSTDTTDSADDRDADALPIIVIGTVAVGVALCILILLNVIKRKGKKSK